MNTLCKLVIFYVLALAAVAVAAGPAYLPGISHSGYAVKQIHGPGLVKPAVYGHPYAPYYGHGLFGTPAYAYYGHYPVSAAVSKVHQTHYAPAPYYGYDYYGPYGYGYPHNYGYPYAVPYAPYG